MAVATVFQYTLNLATTSDVAIDCSSAQGYSSITGNDPWTYTLLVDGQINNGRGGSGVASDNVSLLGSVKGLAAGSHDIQLQWTGSSNITLRNSVMRIIVTAR